MNEINELQKRLNEGLAEDQLLHLQQQNTEILDMLRSQFETIEQVERHIQKADSSLEKSQKLLGKSI